MADEEVPHLTDSSGEDISEDQAEDEDGKHLGSGNVMLVIIKYFLKF